MRAASLALPTTLYFFFDQSNPKSAAIPDLNSALYDLNFLNQTIAAASTLGSLPIFRLTLDANVPIGAVFTGTFCLNCGFLGGGDFVTNAAPFTLVVARGKGRRHAVQRAAIWSSAHKVFPLSVRRRRGPGRYRSLYCVSRTQSLPFTSCLVCGSARSS
jgi:hypothetical protein